MDTAPAITFLARRLQQVALLIYLPHGSEGQAQFAEAQLEPVAGRASLGEQMRVVGQALAGQGKVEVPVGGLVSRSLKESFLSYPRNG